MFVDAARWVRGQVTGVKSWPVWALPGWLAGFIAAVVIADVAAFAIAASSLSVHAHDLALIAALLACSAATVELTRRLGEKAEVAQDVHAIWELPVAILLPIAYVPIVPAVRLILTQVRIRTIPAHRRAFSAAAIGISYIAAALVFRGMIRLAAGAADDPARHAAIWMAVVAVSGATQWAVNHALVLAAIKGSNPDVKLSSVFSREALHNDATELCVAVLVTFCVANTMIALAFAFPFVTLLQRSVRHTQLLNDSRADSKTGLLNAATWEREATAEIARAVRVRAPAAVALLDLDRFKLLNDTYGHLVGDQVLKEVARTLTAVLREYDLAGRFGGEEFALLLPHTRSTDAFRIAERVRVAIAGLRIIAPGVTGGERVSVTVSIGVAALDGGDRREFADLMAAADAALYRAKGSGRDQVQMLSTTRGLSAAGGPGAGGSARGETPIAFRRAVNS
jgi:diguanylate cyclase (GGDEF)-like protein